MAVSNNILSEQEVRELIGDVLQRENLSDATLEISSGSQKGDGYMSLMTKVTATDKNKTLNMILKWAPKSEEFRKMVPLNKTFLREIHFYDVLAPELAKFQAARNVPEPFDGFIKCYKTIHEEYQETIVMDDIIAQGFKLYNRKILMDIEHTKFLLKQYGKFHAISFAMQDQDKDLFEKITRGVIELFMEKCEAFLNALRSSIEDVIGIFHKNEETGIRNALSSFKDALLEFLGSLNNRNKNRVITHGDCWCNNMMFKYEDGKTAPVKLRIYDFQILRINSPMMDLTSLLYGCAPKEVYDNLEHYLHIYHDSYLDHMKALGSDGEKIYPFTELQNDWKKYARYGFMMGTIIHRAATRDEDSTVDILDAAETGKELSDVFSPEGKGKAISDERLRNMALHCYESGFFDEKI